jgi:hypothetical protein
LQELGHGPQPPAAPQGLYVYGSVGRWVSIWHCIAEYAVLLVCARVFTGLWKEELWCQQAWQLTWCIWVGCNTICGPTAPPMCNASPQS